MDVSIIIPVYNAEKYIKKAIESCLQLSEVKEIIVIDDGYKDGAKKIVQAMAEKHDIIKLYEHPNNENKGPGASRNLGIEKTSQEYIAFLDADDFFLPWRFVKDAEVFKLNPEADGCYNAIGSHFYSDKAMETFFKHFKSNITTVNKDAAPTPENLFGGLIGIVPNYGYFSLDGLTLKRNFLLNNNIHFPDLTVHQDTVFIFKIAYYGKLYPSEIDSPVTLRGVHEENRITSNYEQKKKKQYKNRFLMWNSLYEWGKQEHMNKDVLKQFKQQTNLYRVLSASNPSLSDLIIPVFSNVKILLNSNYRNLFYSRFKMRF